MYKNTQVTVTITRVTRAGHSVNGNPRFTFKTGAGDFKTAPDTTQAYAVTGVFDLDTPLNIVARLYTDASGNVTGWDL
jgi:hypothetical protein